MAYSKKKNLISNRDTYNKYYGNFRGVDFSSDHSQVADQRFAYSVNMYKDYKSGQGDAIETIPGFRELITNLSGKTSEISTATNKINGIHTFTCNIVDETKVSDGGVHPKITVKLILIHCGECLYGYCEGYGILSLDDDDTYSTHSLADAPSKSFIFNNGLYIIDGTNYIYVDSKKGLKDSEGLNFKSAISKVSGYVPTTYKNIRPGADTGIEYEHVNALTDRIRNSYIADGEKTSYFLSTNVSKITNVWLYGTLLTEGTSAQVTGDTTNTYHYYVAREGATGEIGVHFKTAPTAPENTPSNKPATNEKQFYYPPDYNGVIIEGKISLDTYTELSNTSGFSSPITKCNICAVYNNDLILSGNPQHPNRVYFSGRHDGYSDPTYFPIVNYFEVGVSNISGVTGLLPIADSLMVLKSDSAQDGTVHFYKGELTEDNLYPVRYEGQRGLSGLGCLGACTSFLDDPVFISRLGVEAVGQLSVRLERAIEHRSSLIDAILVNERLEGAQLEEWEGYLVLLVGAGKIFLADSRQRYTHPSGVMQYEWYYLEDIGVYEDQYRKCIYATEDYDLTGDNVELDTVKAQLYLADESLRGTVVNGPATEDWARFEGTDKCFKIWYVEEDGKKILCVPTDEYIGGELFDPAVCIKSFDGNLFFGTQSGHFCAFNFDKRQSDGSIPIDAYTFNGRRILSGCATKMDNCGIPHLTKNTVKKSTVIKTKTFTSSAAKIKVRTNNEPYKQIDRINSGIFDFENMDFADFTFETTPESLFSIYEKEKRWVEKQYYIYSDEYCKPFALHYIAYRYNICGRFKN